ncbi:MAG: hypothetical protein ABI921_00060 [Panacibacter sp.]
MNNEQDTFGLHQYWKFKKNHSVGLFTDMNLYYEALTIAKNKGVINVAILEKNLLERVIGLKYIETFKKRAFQDLLRELNRFKYIYKDENNFLLTESGNKLLDAYKNSIENYHDSLLNKMNSEHGIPGWFINRLWTINPGGQGQVVVPSPIKLWKPAKQKWKDNLWNDELTIVSEETHTQINKRLPNSFPMDIKNWISEVKKEYERLGKLKQRRVGKKDKEDKEKKMEFFAPRGRLTFAMKNVSVKFLFSNKYIANETNDFITNKINNDPINSRTFMVWCPRLETFELLYYSDYFEEIPGRLIFPCSVFGLHKDRSDFRRISFIKSPNEEFLFRHKPDWENYKKEFIKTLNECYQVIYNKEGIIYVSLQQVRDEVCRLLRISAVTFELFLENTFRESVQRKIEFSIALETDIREDQKSGFQIQRRPIFINNIPNSLIAIKQFI